MKKFVAIVLSLILALSFVACGAPASSQTPASTPGSGSAPAADAGEADYTVGILQFTQHSSLDEICAAVQSEFGVIAAAQGKKLNIVVKNGNADTATINDICTLFVSDKVDIIIPIATPAATAAAAATQATDIPVVFSAVTDPVAAQLVNDMNTPGGNITGTSDYIDVDLILKLALAQNPDLKKLGVIYNLGEPNSVSTVEQLEKNLADKGIEMIVSNVTNSGEVQMATQKLISDGVQALFVPIDNTVADAMSVLSDEAVNAKLPVYTAADSMVRDGGLATIGVNYTRLGELTAQMGYDIMTGNVKAAETPVQVLSDGIITVNTTTAKALGIDPNVFDVFGNGYVVVE